MKTDIWMPLYTGDFKRKTTRLRDKGIGIYTLLIIDLWDNGELPNDREELAFIARTKDMDLLDKILSDFFIKTPTGYTQERVMEEKSKSAEKRKKASENGKMGGRPKGSNNRKVNNKKPNGFENAENTKPNGYEKNNLMGNPEKSYSQSHSESQSNSYSNSEEREKEAKLSLDPEPDSEEENEDRTLSDLIQHWNDKGNLPKSVMVYNFSQVGKCLNILNDLGYMYLMEAIDNLSENKESVEQRYIPGSLEKFLVGGSIGYWHDFKPAPKSDPVDEAEERVRRLLSEEPHGE